MKTLIRSTADHIRSLQSRESSGHDWWHTYRVWQLSKKIAKIEKADLLIVELSALLHDIADWKFHCGDENAGPTEARMWLTKIGADQDVIDAVCDIIRNVSFKGANTKQTPLSLEGKVVQDADRLDAIGAIGIARAFAYGGHKGREMHDPEIRPRTHRSFNDYKKSESTTINHFYEKLLLLKDRMNTKEGRRLAKERHAFMERYLKEFYKEWE